MQGAKWLSLKKKKPFRGSWQMEKYQRYTSYSLSKIQNGSSRFFSFFLCLPPSLPVLNSGPTDTYLDSSSPFPYPPPLPLFPSSPTCTRVWFLSCALLSRLRHHAALHTYLAPPSRRGQVMQKTAVMRGFQASNLGSICLVKN